MQTPDHRQAAEASSSSMPATAAREAGLKNRTNTILQTCFFALSGVLPRDEAIASDQAAHRQDLRPQGRPGGRTELRRRRRRAGPAARGRRCPPRSPASSSGRRWSRPPRPISSATSPARMMEGLGDDIPVSAMPVDGTFPSGTAAWEKRNVAEEVPVWRADLCIQCGQCSFVCPHSVIRAKYYDEEALAGAPDGFKSAPVNARGYPGAGFSLQFYLEDCTGCGLCVEACPANSPIEPGIKAINMAPKAGLVEPEREEHRLLRDAARQRPRPRRFRQCARRAVSRTVVRILRRLRRLRRDALRQAAVAAVRRPPDGRQCHRLLVDLWRQPAGDALDQERRRARAGLVEFAVRGQCRIRPRLPPRRRQASRPCARTCSGSWRPRSARIWPTPSSTRRRSRNRKSAPSATASPCSRSSCWR